MNRRSFFTALVAAPLAACYRPPKAEAGVPHPDRPILGPKYISAPTPEVDYIHVQELKSRSNVLVIRKEHYDALRKEFLK